ncbi:MAG: Zn-dependent hydrolase [Spirulina sp. SIO3F2]|nr:Zn-dependent hydrolase [Spirulina sp. SIO3F2]
MQINSDRLRHRLQQLAQIGRLPNGGVSRLAFSAADQDARAQTQQWLQMAGMTVRIDPAGNLIGRYPGQDETLGAIATGSHLDTVSCGGSYDGALGVIAGVEIAQTLHDAHAHFHHPFEVIVFADEEGSMIGSKAMSGSVESRMATLNRSNSNPLAKALTAIGGNWKAIEQAKRQSEELHAFVELHVEQGPVLESVRAAIGIVEGIVGQRRYQITIEGQANHAGTTPMHLRQDALVAAARVILAVQALANDEHKQTVATVGEIHTIPNTVNVIPGTIKLTVDLRDLCDRHLNQLQSQLNQNLQTIGQETRTKIALQPTLQTPAVLADAEIQAAIEQSCQMLNTSYHYLPSRAGHDAQSLARLTRIGMIFVPSRGGISHSAQEYTAPQHCLQGVQVLWQTLWQCDRQLI